MSPIAEEVGAAQKGKKRKRKKSMEGKNFRGWELLFKSVPTKEESKGTSPTIPGKKKEEGVTRIATKKKRGVPSQPAKGELERGGSKKGTKRGPLCWSLAEKEMGSRGSTTKKGVWKENKAGKGKGTGSGE